MILKLPEKVNGFDMSPQFAFGWNSALDEVERLNKDRVEGLVELVDGCMPIIEIWKAETPAQKEWKLEWIEKARTALQSFREEK